MRHYEVVVLIHPDQSDQVPAMIQRYTAIIKNGGGRLHRLEDWGRRLLAYPISKLHKAHYLLLNIECTKAVMSELRDIFQINDLVLRYLVLQVKHAITKPSPLAKGKETQNQENTKERYTKEVLETVTVDNSPRD